MTCAIRQKSRSMVLGEGDLSAATIRAQIRPSKNSPEREHYAIETTK